ncbi:MAG: hypothetical protein IPN16_23810 [Gemmatimonadetes bacterium]|nr:hypothetical protein [Gemmatimonadota bacterium]
MSAPHHPEGDDRRRFLRFLAASPLLAAGGMDLGALERLTSAGNPDDGWRLLDEVTRATEARGRCSRARSSRRSFATPATR